MNDEKQLQKTADLFRVLAHPVRIKIIMVLKEQEALAVISIRKQIPIEQSMLSHHLNKMKDTGLLGSRRKGKEIHYYIADPAIYKVVDLLLTNQKQPHS